MTITLDAWLALVFKTMSTEELRKELAKKEHSKETRSFMLAELAKRTK